MAGVASRISILLLTSVCLISLSAAEARAQQLENPLEILAVRVREQGHACDNPIKAEQDLRASRPMAAVWVLECSNGTYRILLHPDLGAQIQVVK